MQLTPRDKRMLQVLGAVAGLAIAYFLFTTVLGGGGGETAAPPLTGATGVVTGPSGPTGVPTLSPSPTPRETLPPVVLAGARDPFSIPPALAPTSGSVAPTGPTGPGDPGATSPPTSPPPTSPPPTSPPPTGPPPTSPPPTDPPDPNDPEPQPEDRTEIGDHRVRLVSIAKAGKRVDVKVDHRLYTVEEGARFDENFKLVNIDDPCARFLFGDQSFTLCLDR
jgi:hypothetical protein